MTIQATQQTGGDEPLDRSWLELQQIVLGFFLLWDALGEGYQAKEKIERAALGDWAAKHNISWRTAVEALIRIKSIIQENPWAHFIQCRDFSGEGWVDVLILAPRDNADVLHQIASLLEHQPFKEEP